MLTHGFKTAVHESMDDVSVVPFTIYHTIYDYNDDNKKTEKTHFDHGLTILFYLFKKKMNSLQNQYRGAFPVTSYTLKCIMCIHACVITACLHIQCLLYPFGTPCWQNSTFRGNFSDTVTRSRGSSWLLSCVASSFFVRHHLIRLRLVLVSNSRACRKLSRTARWGLWWGVTSHPSGENYLWTLLHGCVGLVHKVTSYNRKTISEIDELLH